MPLKMVVSKGGGDLRESPSLAPVTPAINFDSITVGGLVVKASGAGCLSGLLGHTEALIP